MRNAGVGTGYVCKTGFPIAVMASAQLTVAGVASVGVASGGVASGVVTSVGVTSVCFMVSVLKVISRIWVHMLDTTRLTNCSYIRTNSPVRMLLYLSNNIIYAFSTA